jgi:hypothetical protein
MAAYRDPDDTLVVLFRHQALQNGVKTLKEGRPVFDDVEVCEVRAPGSKDVKVFHATDISRWVDDPVTGEQRKQSYAERFRHQYQQFKRDAAQTKTGTPLDYAPFLTDGRRAELRAQNVYTVEQLADVEGAELKNLGPGGRDMKNQATAYIEEGKASAPNKQLMHELEALRARNAILEEDAVAKKAREAEEGERNADEFDGMTLDQLREFVTANTGHAPHGSLNRKTLTRMAREAQQKAA